MNKLKIYLLGRVEIILNDESITDKLSHKSIGILNYMAAERNKKFNRNKIADMFWDSNDFDTSRYNLRYNLWQLRKIFKKMNKGRDPFKTDKDTIKFDEKIDIYIDVEEFDKSTEIKDTKTLEKMKNLYKGEFLEGFYIKDSPKFNDWVFYERERYQRNYIRILYQLKDNYKKEREYQKAIKILENMLTINPLKEDIYLELINIYLEIGDRKKALKHYNRCVKRLREELNISPAKEIKRAYKKIIKSESHIGEVKAEPSQYKSKNNNLYIMKTYNQEKNTENSTYLSCYPLSNIDYYLLSELIEKIIGQKENIFEEIDQIYLKDIYPINSLLENYIKEKNGLENQAIKIKVFKALEEILKELSRKDEIEIIIDKFKHIDNISYEFIKFILYRQRVNNIKIILINEEDNEKISDLRSCFVIGT